MKAKKRKQKRQWWQKPRVIRRLAMIGVTALLVGLGAAYIAMRGSDGPEFNARYATHFTLPTTSGEQVTLGQHLGAHNVLLYFNEGMG